MIKRRQFVKNIAISGTVIGSGITSAFSFQNKKPLGVALVGLGYYSTDLLAPALQLTKHCQLRGIVTGSPEKIKPWQQKYKIPDGNVYNYENMHEIANNSDIDVIYIVLPPGLHAKYGIIAANAGKHVWCEKPMAVTATECQQIIDACNKNKVKLSIGYRLQHEPNTQKIINWASSRPYGQINQITANAGYVDGRTDHWKQKKELGGGSMYDMGVYSLNAARYSSGLEPITVSANYETNRPEIYSEVDETTNFILEFPEGIIAKCSTSFGKNMNDLKVTCADGWYELKPFQQYSGIQGTTSDGKVLNASIPNQQARQMDDDALAIIQNTEVMVPGEEGLKDIRIVEAIHRSASNNSMTIKL